MFRRYPHFYGNQAVMHAQAKQISFYNGLITGAALATVLFSAAFWVLT